MKQREPPQEDPSGVTVDSRVSHHSGVRCWPESLWCRGLLPSLTNLFFFFFQQMHSRVTSHTTKLMTTAYVKSLGRTNPLASRSKNLAFSFMFACQVKLQKPVYINIMNYLINTMSYVNKWWNKLPKIYLSWNSSKKILNK